MLISAHDGPQINLSIIGDRYDRDMQALHFESKYHRHIEKSCIWLIDRSKLDLQGLVPIKWMAIESIKDSIYTEKTDM